MEKKRDEEIKSGIGQRDLHPAERFVGFFVLPTPPPLPSPPSSDPTALRRANGDQDLEKFPKQPRRVSEAALGDPATSS